MPIRLCLEATCGRPATYKGRCGKHARRREREINRVGRKVYSSKRWRILRQRKLFEQPLCERCGALATDVHHRHGVEADPWSLTGLESLCRPCHSQITRREQLGHA